MDEKLADWQRWMVEFFREHPTHIHVDLHVAGPIHLHVDDASDGDVLQRILTNTERIIVMSDTFHTDLGAQTAAVQALATEVQDGLTANAAAIQALKDQIAAGNPVTPADLATMEGNTSAIAAAVTALQAALNPPPPPPPPAP